MPDRQLHFKVGSVVEVQHSKSLRVRVTAGGQQVHLLFGALARSGRPAGVKRRYQGVEPGLARGSDSLASRSAVLFRCSTQIACE